MLAVRALDECPGNSESWFLAHCHTELVAAGVRGVVSFADLLADRLRVLGPDHPDTLTTRADLAFWRGRFRDAARAAATAELLVDFLRVLGPDHPATLSARHKLAYWRGEAGDAAGASTGSPIYWRTPCGCWAPAIPPQVTRNYLAHWQGQADGDPGRGRRTVTACGGAAEAARPPGFDVEAYKQRNTVERCINRLKQGRGLATRTDK